MTEEKIDYNNNELCKTLADFGCGQYSIIRCLWEKAINEKRKNTKSFPSYRCHRNAAFSVWMRKYENKRNAGNAGSDRGSYTR